MEKPVSPVLPLASYWALGGVVIGLLLVDASAVRLVAHSWTGDYWEHAAAVTELMRDPWSPGNPHLATAETSARYMPYFVVLALLARPFGLTAMTALAVAGIVNFCLLLASVHLFFRHYFANPWSPLIALATLLGSWGIAWHWSNVYQIRGLFYVAAFPSNFVFSVFFFGLFLVVGILRDSRWAAVMGLGLMLLTALMLLSHPLTALPLIGFILLFAALDVPARPVRRLYAMVAVALGLLLSSAWPYFPIWQLVLGRGGQRDTTWMERGQLESVDRLKSLYWGHPFYDPAEVMLAFGATIIGFLSLYLLLRRGKALAIALSAAVSFGIYVLNGFFHIPLGHRFLLLGLTFLQFAIIWHWSSLPAVVARGPGKVSPAAPAVAYGAIIGLALLWNIGLAGFELSGSSLHPDLSVKRVDTPVVETMEELGRQLPPNAIVLGPPVYTWSLPAFGGKTVALFHSNPFVEDEAQRGKDTDLFFTPDATDQVRSRIIDRYGVTHVLMAAGDMPREVASFVGAHGSVVAEANGLSLVRLEH